MHPFSRGRCYISSADPFQAPSIDPRWLSNPVDKQILIEAMLFNRRILATPPMALLQPAQFVPPIDADEAALIQIINSGIRTEYHPSGTCAMLPLAQGGVLDSHLRVWGTANLRVVDASVFPMIPAAHLQAVVYAVAEKVGLINLQEGLVLTGVNRPQTSSRQTTLRFSQAQSHQHHYEVISHCQQACEVAFQRTANPQRRQSKTLLPSHCSVRVSGQCHPAASSSRQPCRAQPRLQICKVVLRFHQTRCLRRFYQFLLLFQQSQRVCYQSTALPPRHHHSATP